MIRSTFTRGSIGLPALALLVVLGGAPAGASGATRLDLDACIDAAEANNPRLNARAARLELQEAKAQVLKANRLPSLTISAETGYLDGYAITPFALLRNVTEEGLLNREVDGGYYQAVAGLHMPLFGGGLESSARQARNIVSANQWEIEAERTAAASTVAGAYAEALKQADAVGTHEKRVALFESDIAAERARFEQDLISENEVLIAEVRLETARRDLAVARLALQRGFDTLSAAMGLPPDRVLDLQPFPEVDAPSLTRDELADLLREHHPVLKAQRYNVEAQNHRAKSIRAGRYPRVELNARYGMGNAFDDVNEETESQYQAALMAKIPVFSFGLDRKKAAVARAHQAEAERSLEIMRLAVGQKLAGVYAALEQSEAELDLIDAQIAQGEAEVRLHEAMVAENLASETQLHESQTKLLILQLDRRDAGTDRKLARYRLKLLQEAAGSRLK